MNNLDNQYKNIIKQILKKGYKKLDRTNTGTISIFGTEIRHKMSEGFPIITTKKIHFKSVVIELLWFLQGNTNIKYLIDNNVNIWNGDAYKEYLNTYFISSNNVSYKNNNPSEGPCDYNEWLNKMKTNDWFSSFHGKLGPIYGKQWRKWQGFVDLPDTHYLAKGSIWHDQIGVLIKNLKTNPDSRRLIVSSWNVADLHHMVLPPCHYSFECWTRELTLEERIDICAKKPKFDPLDFGIGLNLTKEQEHEICDLYDTPKRELSLKWNQRSVDTGLGLPFNITSYGLLLEILCKEVNMLPGELIGSFGDTHIYTNHVDKLKEQLELSSYDLPKLYIKDKMIEDISEYEYTDFELVNYQSHPSIKLELSN